jgi:two-component system, chemotaxis family, response regulator Rcp1
MRRSSQILLVEDNPADVTLVYQAWARTERQPEIRYVADGEQAKAYLDRAEREDAPWPDLIILDLNVPGKNGRTLLSELKTDPVLRTIPVVVFSTSQSNRDVLACYRLGANCYVSKPGNLSDFFATIRLIEEFWLGCASLPEEIHDGAATGTRVVS